MQREAGRLTWYQSIGSALGMADLPTSLMKRVNRNRFRLRSTGTGFSYRLMFSPAERVRCIFKLEPPTYVHRKDDEERGSTRWRLNIYIGVKYIYMWSHPCYSFFTVSSRR